MADVVAPLPEKQLRAELKEWEKAFAAANGGRKACRDDIKKEPSIAQKYKEYNRLTGRVCARGADDSAAFPPLQCRKRRREPTADEASTYTSEKSSHQLRPSDIDPYDIPPQRTPSAVRTYVRPTPQKNGQVLGIFDLLSPSGTAINTPSRASDTPSKIRKLSGSAAQVWSPLKAAGMAQAATSQPSLSKFLTPSTKRFHSQPEPSSDQSKHEDTPIFLRRHTRLEVQHNDVDCEGTNALEISPLAVRLPPRPAGKGLSVLVQGLKHMEEERLDDELDVLRELESQESGGICMVKKPMVLGKNSQIVDAVELRLGADGEQPESEDDDLADVSLSQPTRTWKKRGQKRTTRLANIAPSTAKWKPEPEWRVGEDEEREDQIANTQAEHSSTANPTKTNKDGHPGTKPGLRKMISATAHANFRALKIRSRFSKGKGGGFRGRRR